MDVILAADPQELARRACGLVMTLLSDAWDGRGHARVVLSGGSTPRATYRLLAEALLSVRIPVGSVTWFFGDERWVDRADPLSNEGMARSVLLEPLGAPERSIRSWNAGAGDPVECARAYADAAAAEMPPAGVAGPDVVLLGIGLDGHTASLFPGGTVRLPGGVRLPVGPDIPADAAAVEPEGSRGWRLTFTRRMLERSRDVIFLATGSDKAAAVARACRGDPGTPAGWIRGRRTRLLATPDALGAEMPPGAAAQMPPGAAEIA